MSSRYSCDTIDVALDIVIIQIRLLWWEKIRVSVSCAHYSARFECERFIDLLRIYIV